MKTDTTKLYAKMSPKELARLHHKSYDLEECNKIMDSVPRKLYDCLDAEFTEDLKFLNFVSMWAECEYWRTSARLYEHFYEGAMHTIHHLHLKDHNRLSILYLSRLKAIELALEHHDIIHILPMSQVRVNADGMVKVYELEYEDDFLKAMTANFIEEIRIVLECDYK